VTVTIPPEVVRMRASSTVFVKASSFTKRDLAGIVIVVGGDLVSAEESYYVGSPQAGGAR
jgi:hypothetical protein